ncbi:UNVERIFIED_CONTAM: hypothetical protein GTU68_020122 [Idotea baltica]|nr:hypothetical protein [Idotea baltica]
MIILIGIWIFFMRQMQGGAGKGMSFGKSRAKLLTESQQKVTFEDVAGIDEARAELEEIIDFLREPKKFTRLGGRIPKGLLLVGSPGTGKTLLAKAIAGEAGVPFFSISGSDFVEMFVGVGASRVRDLFIQGKKNAPCIIFIDEIDAVGRHRGAGVGGGHDEREQTLNQLLVEMDGFESNEGVILIAATNRPDVLDPALLRPGRFDRRVMVPTPDAKGREGILKVHSRNSPLADDVDLALIARGTPGFSGAELEILVNEAALFAARKGAEKITNKDLEFAKDKVMMGAERRSLILTDKEKETTAYHEAGHALVAKLLPNADPVHKLTIVPRGMALGLMQQLPEHDKHTYSKSYWMDQLAVFFGGRVAEELIFDEMNTGASSDIERATAIARRMVCEWGMSDKLGAIHYSTKKDDSVFLGRDMSTPREYSDQTQIEIDHEVKRILDGQKTLAEKLLSENIEKLHSLAKAVIEEETLDAARIENLDGHKLPDEIEFKIEELMDSEILNENAAKPNSIGKAFRLDDALGRYIVQLKNSFAQDLSLSGFKLGLDCANGAAYVVAPNTFSELGADITVRGNSPNGKNINDGFGSEYPKIIQELVVSNNLDLGIAFDGDADRAVICDEKGKVLDGDMVLAICALDLQARGLLKSNTVVGTVMSNIGLQRFLDSKGIKLIRSGVGDRYVLEKLRENDLSLGGEQSGHTIFSDFSTTGDGILTGLKVLEVMLRNKKTISELLEGYEKFPQELINIDVSKKPELETIDELQNILILKEKELKDTGRILVRYSGTENKARVMVECETEDSCKKHASDIAEVIQKSIGSL